MISVLIVDEHGESAKEFERCLHSSAWLRVVGCARTKREVEVLGDYHTPDVVLLAWPHAGAASSGVLSAARNCGARARLVVVTDAAEPLELDGQPLEAAACLHREALGEALVTTIASLFPAVATGTVGPELTPREAEVGRLAVAGLSNAEIGRALYISENTVKTHLAHVLQKFGLSSRIALARRWPLGS